jgi:glutathione synthase/RimK-type ligase-like ATP-grasp enzyme
MKRFAVLGTRYGWHCEQIMNAFERRGAQAEFVTAEQLVGPLGIPGREAPLSRYDGLVIRGIPAGSLEQVIYRMDALYALERGGVPCVNSPKTIEKTVDKYLTSALLAEAGLPVPPTICCESFETAKQTFGDLGGDVVYKPLFGSCGNGLLRLQSERDAERALKRSRGRAASSIFRNSFRPATPICGCSL